MLEAWGVGAGLVCISLQFIQWDVLSRTGSGSLKWKIMLTAPPIFISPTRSQPGGQLRPLEKLRVQRSTLDVSLWRTEVSSVRCTAVWPAPRAQLGLWEVLGKHGMNE